MGGFKLRYKILLALFILFAILFISSESVYAACSSACFNPYETAEGPLCSCDENYEQCIKPFTKSTASATYSGQKECFITCSSSSGTDTCQNSRYLSEYYVDCDCCDSVTYTTIDCKSYNSCSGDTLTDYGCSSGRCAATTKNCNDYDTWYCDGQYKKHQNGYCSGGSCSTNVDQTIDCGTNYCESWSSNYCNGDNIEKKRVCHNKGCSSNNCYNNTYYEYQTVKNCNDYNKCDDTILQCNGDQIDHRCYDYKCFSGSCIVNNYNWSVVIDTRDPDMSEVRNGHDYFCGWADNACGGCSWNQGDCDWIGTAIECQTGLFCKNDPSTNRCCYNDELVKNNQCTKCGNAVCDSGETYSNCPQDCCEADCTAKSDLNCHSTCDTYNGCYLTSGCDSKSSGSKECVDYNTYKSCCEGGNVDCAADKFCSNGNCVGCSATQCVKPDLQQCFNSGSLCCSSYPVTNQYYCETNVWRECTITIACQQKGSYYCTGDGGIWKWRICSFGCSGGMCLQPDIDVSPTSLLYEIGK